jgi:hypothetical protein
MAPQGRVVAGYPHGIVSHFIILPNFGQAPVHVPCDKRHSRVRSGTGLGFLSPPAPRGLCRPTPFLFRVRFNPPTLLGRCKSAHFLCRTVVVRHRRSKNSAASLAYAPPCASRCLPVETWKPTTSAGITSPCLRMCAPLLAISAWRATRRSNRLRAATPARRRASVPGRRQCRSAAAPRRRPRHRS